MTERDSDDFRALLTHRFDELDAKVEATLEQARMTNGRVTALEMANAERDAADKARGGLVRWAFLAGGFAAAVATVLNMVLTRI